MHTTDATSRRQSRRRRGGADVFFVEARYHKSPKRAADQVRDIAGREEGLRDGVRRELYGIFVSGCLKRSGREWGRSTAARESPRGVPDLPGHRMDTESSAVRWR